MKKLQLIFLCILMIALCGCGKKPEPEEVQATEEPMEIASSSSTHTEMSAEESYEQWYKTILDSNYELIMGGADTYDYQEGTSGIGEVIMNSDGTEANAIGYTFLDVNHDGVAEPFTRRAQVVQCIACLRTLCWMQMRPNYHARTYILPMRKMNPVKKLVFIIIQPESGMCPYQKS